MPYRRFVDSAGQLWRVWDVLPSPVDRRVAARRLRNLRIFAPERRVLPTRRVDVLRSRLFFPPSEPGWLCFEAEGVKRRLHPIPSGWAHDSDAALEALCRRAGEDTA